MKRISYALLSLLCLACVFGGSGAAPGPSSPSGPSSCHYASSSFCSQRSAAQVALLGVSDFQSTCADLGGTYAPGPCSTDGLLGHCDTGHNQVTVYYSNGGTPYTPESAAAECAADGGRFAPGAPAP